MFPPERLVPTGFAARTLPFAGKISIYPVHESFAVEPKLKSGATGRAVHLACAAPKLAKAINGMKSNGARRQTT
jgi:hypothetical protein